MQSGISIDEEDVQQCSSNLLSSGFSNTDDQRSVCAASPIYSTFLSTNNPVLHATVTNDTELPLVMASLKICDALTSDSLNVEHENSSRRILRSHTQSADLATQNRRCNLKPAKIDNSDIEAYYLNKKYQKPVARYLETIYEEPVIKKNGASCVLGPKKARRIRFSGITKPKDKKRKANLKKMIRNSVSKRASFTQEEFITHLCSLMLEDVCKMDAKSLIDNV